ncbi:RYamide receptor [Hyalella azteca]|uniref:RYamide receptor n=1 Tax=Hyalella azteca TaxID=294128 RepID=A0A8B7NFF8_HYAAZ|nr:RYamide receptor [Hyalella azteca]
MQRISNYSMSEAYTVYAGPNYSLDSYESLNSTFLNSAITALNAAIENSTCGAQSSGYNLSFMNYTNPTPKDFLPLKLTLTSIIFSTATIGNSLVIFLIWLNPSFHSAINCYLLNLAVADLLITFTCIWTHTIVDVKESYPFGRWVCESASVIQATCVLGSVLTMAVVSLERVHAVLLPLRARRVPRQHLLTVMCLWLIAAAGASPFFALKTYQEDLFANYVDHQCRYTQPPGVVINNTCVRPRHNFVHYYHITFSTLLFFLPVTVMTLGYSRIVAKLWSIRVVGEQSACSNRAQNSARKKVVALSCTLLLVFTLCWGPLQVLVIFSLMNDMNEEANAELQFWLTFLGYSNSALNPIIYVWFSSSFRHELLSMIRKGFRQRSWGSYASSSLTQATRTSSGASSNSAPRPRVAAKPSREDPLQLKPVPAAEWSRNSWRDKNILSGRNSVPTANGLNNPELCIIAVHMLAEKTSSSPTSVV